MSLSHRVNGPTQLRNRQTSKNEINTLILRYVMRFEMLESSYSIKPEIIAQNYVPNCMTHVSFHLAPWGGGKSMASR